MSDGLHIELRDRDRGMYLLLIADDESDDCPAVIHIGADDLARLRGKINTALDGAPTEEECPGDGHCHGCQKWCDWCGDVSGMCDDHICYVHKPSEAEQ